MLDIHLVEDGRAVVGDNDVPRRANEHFVHALGPERRPYRLGDRLAGLDVRRLGVPSLGPLGVFTEDEYRLTAHLLSHWYQ